ncbi:hypothetical protein KI688_000530 [Linnemannia hyalina]|uniref:Uncharacterized protein n=1 Tax=Linnemannia hyalina TaxID=64524 RepID=A0A9P7Y3M9_9FUNG|nr:hypothetical protein KI688_000530 [Linnemannia hyalina]
MYNPLKKQHLKTTVVFSAFLTAFGFLQFYLYTDTASANHICALEAFLYHIKTTLDQLETDPREDRRRGEERQRLSGEYLATSLDLEDIRPRKKVLGGKNPGVRKVVKGGVEGLDQDQDQKEEEGAMVKVRRRSSRNEPHSRRQLDEGDEDLGDAQDDNEVHTEEEGDANTPLEVGGNPTIEDLQQQQQQQSTTTTTPIDESSSNNIPDHESLGAGGAGETSIEFEIRPTVIVYNMGMGPTKRRKRRFQALVEADGLIDQAVDLDFQKYPDFWQLGTPTRGEYGWKAGIIEEVSQRVLASPSSGMLPPTDLQQQHPGSAPPLSNNNPTTNSTTKGPRHEQGIVLWLDSGDRISVPFLRWLPSFLLQNGMWSPQSQSDMQTWTHPGLFSYYHDSMDNYDPKESNCNGAAMAFDVRNHTMRDGIMREWVQCSLTKDCIAPEGSSRANHRQDQAALTYLVKRMGYGRELCHGMPDVYGIQVNQDRYCNEDIAAQPDRVVYN